MRRRCRPVGADAAASGGGGELASVAVRARPGGGGAASDAEARTRGGGGLGMTRCRSGGLVELDAATGGGGDRRRESWWQRIDRRRSGAHRPDRGEAGPGARLDDRRRRRLLRPLARSAELGVVAFGHRSGGARNRGGVVRRRALERRLGYARPWRRTVERLGTRSSGGHDQVTTAPGVRYLAFLLYLLAVSGVSDT
ncbi:uncharacterized protein M6B38_397050 [Iris pallida]|uniref:Uncharacterized protein n=1 Tax=Iris pallida TaxID=29817 RepID=A0AAX6FWL0_IRIPA|nr:uncharacterized protein M6B38_397050 [Iris pallida]